MRTSMALTVLFVLCLSSSLPAQTLRYRADISVSGRSGGNAWVGYVRDARGHGTAYEFLLEPNYDVGGLLSGWDLLLFRVEQCDENLLEPAGRWHGLQPFNFTAKDLAAGPDKSAFGRTRTIPVRGTKSKVMIRIVGAQLASPDELRSITLHVELWDPD